MNWQTIGFQKIKKNFEDLYNNKKLGHAYLFTGQDMIGKKTFALELAKKLNSIQGKAESHPDIFYLGAQEKEGSKILIEKIRELKKFISLKPYVGPYKFVIIDNADSLTQEAGNSMLKTLEEPSAGSILILISSQPHQILPTIVSRCETVKFPPHRPEILRDYFNKLGLNEEQVEFLINFSNGRIGMAIDLHRNNSFPLIRKTIEDFLKLVKAPIYQRFDFIAKLLDDKFDYNAKTALLFWILYLRSPMSAKLKINKAVTLKNLSNLYYYIHQPQFNHRLIFENTLIKL